MYFHAKSSHKLLNNDLSCPVLLRLISPGWLFLLIAAVLFIVEITLMSVLTWMPQITPIGKASLDATVLLCVFAVGFYLFFYRPLQIYTQNTTEQTKLSNNQHRDTLLNNTLYGAQTAERTLALLSPKRLVPLMVISIFLSETVVMFIISLMPQIPVPLEALFDASGLLIILSPTFYFFHYRPIQHHYLDRKKIIDKLSASEERLQLALQAVNDSLWDYDLVTGDAYVSPRGEKMLGFSPGEIEPSIEGWKVLLHPEEKEQVLILLNAHLDGQTSHYMLEHRLKCKDGGWIWVLARGQVVSRDAENRPLRMVGTHTDITPRKHAEEALRRSEEEIRSLSHKLIHTSEEEKKYLAQDLHDEFGQVLTAFQLGVEMLRDHRYDGDNDYQFHCNRLLKLVARLEVDLRNICDHLRPVMLDDIGLIATLRWHINEFVMVDKSIDIDFKVQGQQALSREQEIVLYRICQEGLNNIAKHARAGKVNIELVLNSVQVSLTIRDDGEGMDQSMLNKPTQTSWGLGLLGMRERAAAVGGHLTVESIKGQGTVVRAELPVTAAEGFSDAN